MASYTKIALPMEERESREIQETQSQSYHKLGLISLLACFQTDDVVDTRVSTTFPTHFELIRHSGAVRADGNYMLTSVLAKPCIETKKQILKESTIADRTRR